MIIRSDFLKMFNWAIDYYKQRNPIEFDEWNEDHKLELSQYNLYNIREEGMPIYIFLDDYAVFEYNSLVNHTILLLGDEYLRFEGNNEDYVYHLIQRKKSDGVTSHSTIVMDLLKILQIQYNWNQSLDFTPLVTAYEKENGPDSILRHENKRYSIERPTRIQ